MLTLLTFLFVLIFNGHLMACHSTDSVAEEPQQAPPRPRVTSTLQDWLTPPRVAEPLVVCNGPAPYDRNAYPSPLSQRSYDSLTAICSTHSYNPINIGCRCVSTTHESFLVCLPPRQGLDGPVRFNLRSALFQRFNVRCAESCRCSSQYGDRRLEPGPQWARVGNLYLQNPAVTPRPGGNGPGNPGGSLYRAGSSMSIRYSSSGGGGCYSRSGNGVGCDSATGCSGAGCKCVAKKAPGVAGGWVGICLAILSAASGVGISASGISAVGGDLGKRNGGDKCGQEANLSRN